MSNTLDLCVQATRRKSKKLVQKSWRRVENDEHRIKESWDFIERNLKRFGNPVELES